MKTRKKRLLSILTCVAMLVVMVPMNIFATENTTTKGEHHESTVKYDELSGTEITVPQLLTYSDSSTVNMEFCDGTHNHNKYVGQSDYSHAFKYEDYEAMRGSGEEYSNYGAIMMIWTEYARDNCYAALKLNNKYYSNNLAEITTPMSCTYNKQLLFYAQKLVEMFTGVANSTDVDVLYDETTLTNYIKKFDLVFFSDATFNNPVHTVSLADVIEKPITAAENCSQTATFKYNANKDLVITDFKIDGVSELGIKEKNSDIEHKLGITMTVNGQEYTICDKTGAFPVYTIPSALLEDIEYVYLYKSFGIGNPELKFTLKLVDSSILIGTEIPVPSQTQTVTVTPTVSVVDMPADGTKTEGFDITFKSDVPVVLTTQEAPDTSVCSITTKQSDGSYTGVYHVGEVGNTDIKFNVKPTVASTMSDDGLTKTVYSSTSYTLKINAFASDYKPPVDITDTGDGVIPDDEVIKEVSEGDIPDDNKPNVPATGDSTNATLYLVIILASLTIIVFCVRHKSKAKKALMIILVCAMIGGSIAGPSMVPTTAYADDLTGDKQGSTQGYPVPAGKPSAHVPLEVGYVFMLVPNTTMNTFLKNGWTATALKTSDIKNWCMTAYQQKGLRITIGDGGNTFYTPPFKSINTVLNALYDNAPTDIKSKKPSFSSSYDLSLWTNSDAEKSIKLEMHQILEPFYALTDTTSKAKIVNSLFGVSTYTKDNINSYKLICVPITLGSESSESFTGLNGYSPAWSYFSNSNVWENAGRGAWGVPMNNHCWKFAACIGTNSCLYISNRTDNPNQDVYSEKNEIGEPIYRYRGLGSVFKVNDSITIVSTSYPTKTAYSSYINFALDNKNTTAKSTYDSTSGSTGYASYDNRITFAHKFKLDITTVDGIETNRVYTDLGYEKSGSLTAASGTKVTNNSVFNSQGYAIVGARSAGGATPFPYIEYKWVPTSTGGIGNKWSLDITTKSGTCYGITNYFTAISQYRSYLGSTSIPALSNMLSMLSKNANENGTNRFSNSAYMKFVAGSSTALNSFTSLPSSANSVYNLNQACYSDLAVITATYTPINVTSKIVQVDLKQSGNSFVVDKLTDGASKTYSNQSSTTFTTPTGYTYYKAVAVGSANLKVGATVTSSGLTACNKTTLTVGSSSIDKGYVIYCYKVPDELKFTVDVASYVKENYINNIDFVYNNYNNGWKYSVAPKVSGSLNTIYNNWTSKVNSIMAGCETANVDTVSKLAHQRTFMFNVNRGAYQTLNLSPFITGMSGYANTNGLSGISSQVSTNKPGVTTMNSGTTVSGSAPNKYNNYCGVTNKTVFTPTGSLIAQSNIWRGTTDTFSVSGFNLNKALINYKNTTYVGIYNAPSIGTQSVTNKDLVAAGKTYAEVSNTGVKLSFVPHYEMQLMGVSDTTSPYNYSSRVTSKISIMSNYQRSFNAAMLSGYRFDSLTPEGKTVSDYVDNSGSTLKGSDMTLTVKDTGLRLNTYAYVLDIYGDGDSNEKINGYNPASEWGINSYSALMNKANAKFADYLSNAQNNLAYSVTLDNEGKKYKDFTISKSNATINSSVTTDNNVYQLTVKNGAIVNDTAYQNMLKQIKSDFSLASTTEAETMFKNSGIVDMIMNSMHTSAAANNTSTDKWYDEGTNTICIRRFAKEGMKVASNLVVQDKVDYDSKTGDAEWSLTIKNGSTVVLEDKIEDAEFEISDKTTQSN